MVNSRGRAGELLAARIRTLVEAGVWDLVTGPAGTSARWMQEVPTPAPILKSRPCPWDSPTYTRRVFITVFDEVIMTVHQCPWLATRDQTIPFWLANSVLDDPTLAFDARRQADLKGSRRKGKG
jgi:hypothetical protein